MRRRLGALLLLAALAWPAAVSAASYDELLAQAKRGDPATDYQALRYAFAASPAYQPYGGPAMALKQPMFEALRAGDCAKATALAAKILDIVYVNIDAHIIGDLCDRRLNRIADADAHRRAAQGLLRSILASGDGKAPATAYVVIGVDEEYSLLAALGYRTEHQSLVREAGHSYDRMDVVKRDGAKSTFFFNVDLPLGTLQRQLQPQRK